MMKRQFLFLLIIAGFLTFFSACKKQANYNTLIITGQNNHNWKASSPVLKQLLDQTGLFTTEIATTPGKGGDMNSFNPDFSKYKLVVLDYNGDSWSDKTKEAFLKFVKNGGGVVVYHAADNSFPEWKEYNEIIGLGGWGNRNEKSGPYVYYKGNDLIRDDTAKGIGGTHGARSEFLVRNRTLDHPITKGLPVNWMHGNDELYSRLRGPAVNMEILATATSGTRESARGTAPAQGTQAARTAAGRTQGTSRPSRTSRTSRPSQGVNRSAAIAPPPPPRVRAEPRDEPVLMTISYGKGRIFHTVLGHADEGGGPAMQCVGFIVTFQRGAEWAASGKVTQEVPFDFPTMSGVVLRTDYKELTQEEDFSNIESYDVTKSTKYFVDLQARIRKSSANGEDLSKYEKLMVEILKNNKATIESKKLILRELSWMGSDFSVSAIKDLAATPELKDEAEFALSRLQTGKQ